MSKKVFREPVYVNVRAEKEHVERAKMLGIEFTELFRTSLDSEISRRTAKVTNKGEMMAERYKRKIRNPDTGEIEEVWVEPFKGDELPRENEGDYLKEIREDRRKRGIE